MTAIDGDFLKFFLFEKLENCKTFIERDILPYIKPDKVKAFALNDDLLTEQDKLILKLFLQKNNKTEEDVKKYIESDTFYTEAVEQFQNFKLNISMIDLQNIKLCYFMFKDKIEEGKNRLNASLEKCFIPENFIYNDNHKLDTTKQKCQMYLECFDDLILKISEI